MHCLLSIYFNNSASILFELSGYITMRGTQNIKKQKIVCRASMKFLCCSALQKKVTFGFHENSR